MSRTADEILSIKQPEMLFENDQAKVKKLYRDLVKLWHPDVCKDKKAPLVLDHLTKLHDRAIEKLTSSRDCWGYEGVFNGFRYKKKIEFELGRFYMREGELVYDLLPDNKSYLQNFQHIRTKFNYANDKMRKEVERYLPTMFVKLGDTQCGLKYPKDMIRLREVMNHFGGSLDPKHVAWIMSTLYNLSCYLQYTGIVHQDISPDTYFINPKDHSGALLGGWWYSKPQGETIKNVPARTFKVMPFQAKTKKIASRGTDAELILATGRELLGDIRGKNLNAATPKPMRDWLNAVADKEAIKNYQNWKEVLKASFGPRKFVEMSLSSEQVY